MAVTASVLARLGRLEPPTHDLEARQLSPWFPPVAGPGVRSRLRIASRVSATDNACLLRLRGTCSRPHARREPPSRGSPIGTVWTPRYTKDRANTPSREGKAAPASSASRRPLSPGSPSLVQIEGWICRMSHGAEDVLDRPCAPMSCRVTPGFVSPTGFATPCATADSWEGAPADGLGSAPGDPRTLGAKVAHSPSASRLAA